MKIMNRFILMLLTVIAIPAMAQNLSKRVIPNDPAKYRELTGVHAGAGKMKFTGLIGAQTLGTNFLYLHAGEIPDKAGIGQHFHHTIEEMYVILDGEAEFTINGHTSKIKGPAVVPCKMGDSHGMLNTSGKTLKWLNFAVSTTKGRGDNFDLADNLVGRKLDPIPQFVSGQLKRESLRANSAAYAGNGVLYRRILGPDIFSTSWNHVDHVLIPAGATAGPHQLIGVDEVYYVIKGSGNAAIGSESAALKADNAFYGSIGETINFTNTGTGDMELLVIGIAPSTKKDQRRLQALAQPKAMVLQMNFVVTKENSAAFEKMYHSIYVPAMTVQQGYISSKLLRLYPEALAKEIEAEPTKYNYQIQICFDTEESRRKWVASPQHKIAWPSATSLAKEYNWYGYDVMGDDDQEK
jgi:mannose-6-phosphate isomerase-like protein (cupin superfamily)/heme-degrading monooxygenase HmoA